MRPISIGRLLVAAGAYAVAGSSLSFHAAAADETPAARPALVERALFAYADATRGVVGYRAHVVSTAQAAGRVTRGDVTIGRLLVDDALVAAKVYRVFSDGSDTTPAATEKLQEALDRKIAAPPRSPLRAAHASDYRYEVVPCRDCSPGVVLVQFTSLVRDSLHDDGKMWIEQQGSHVVKVVSKATSLPSPITSSETTTTYGEVLPGTWGALRTQTHTTARISVMTLDSQTVETADRYRRFGTVEEGRAAVNIGLP